VALAIPFAAAHEVQKAIAVWPSRPALAYGELRSASSLLPFDAQIYRVGGAIALDLGEAGTAHRWFEEAESSDGQDWLAPFVLGLLDSEQGRREAARLELRRAQQLNPREPLIAQALVRLPSRAPLTVAEAQSDLSLRAQARFGR
jgi:Flp pilus assembly protein TadD